MTVPRPTSPETPPGVAEAASSARDERRAPPMPAESAARPRDLFTGEASGGEPRFLRVAAIPGDGIGPVVTNGALEILRAACERCDITLTIERLPYGAAHYLATGEAMPAGEAARLGRDADAVFIGALGDTRIPDHAHARAIRQSLVETLDLYAALRPVRSLLPVLSPLARVRDGRTTLDCVVIREEREGFDVTADRRVRVTDDQDAHIAEEWHTPHRVSRLLRFALMWAHLRERRRVTLVHLTSQVPQHRLWRHTLELVAREFPTVSCDMRPMDRVQHDLVRSPERFDVLVTTRLFGDLLGDLAAGLAGGIGLATSALVHPGRCAVFTPVHGAAPDLVGTSRANPLAAIRTAGLLLETCGHRDASQMIAQAVAATLRAQVMTPDLGGHATTDAVIGRVLREVWKTARPSAQGRAAG